MANEKLIRASEARKAILKEAPQLAYCIDNVKDVDAVEVVRCKGCAHWKDAFDSTETETYCDIGFYKIGENGFCSYGERAEEPAKTCNMLGA